MEKNKAIILGAGPTGLITAWKLLEAGWKVDIIEKKMYQEDYVDPGSIKILLLIQVLIYFILQIKF